MQMTPTFRSILKLSSLIVWIISSCTSIAFAHSSNFNSYEECVINSLSGTNNTKAVEFINILTIFTLTFIGATFNVLDAYTKSSIIALLGVMIFILYRMKLFEDASYKQIKILNDKMEDIKKNIDIIIDFIDNL